MSGVEDAEDGTAAPALASPRRETAINARPESRIGSRVMAKSIGILIFDDVEELDFVGPWEVLTMANEVAAHQGVAPVHDVKLIAQTDAPVRCAKGMRVLPDLTTAACDKLDILLVPGGFGTRRLADDAHNWPPHL